MAEADWSIAIGILVFMVAIVFAAYFYFKYKKISLIAFVASIATYIFAVFYTWDVFELSKNLILVLLALSTAVMFFIGSYFSKVNYTEDKPHTSLKEKKNEK